MKNLNETNIEMLNLNEMLKVRGGGEDGDEYNDGRDGDCLIWQ